ncbi:MAG TPA: ectonucleotide pyrophosphatase/phosphodiesterase [Planctomycetota bacterium]|nr:ectonucleotide pyrophosphatase/phosphodiesterase [Planctomycetota bacterium]
MARTFTLPALLLLTACAGTPDAPLNPKDRLVVLISIDGLPADVLNDPLLHIPTLRRLIAEGASAEGMRCSFPTVTWPNHTTLVTGVSPAKHGVLANSYYDRSQQKVVPLLPDPLFDKEEIVKVRTIYDVAHAAGLKTAGIIWPATRNARSLDWTVPDCGTKELWDRYGTASWLEELRREGIPVDLQESWVKNNGGVQRDWMYTRAAAQVIGKHHPNLVLLHLVEVDHVEHAKGPRTPDAAWAASQADDRVRDVIEAISSSGLKERATVFVVSDHGFFGFTKQIQVGVGLKKAGLKAASVSQGGASFIYVDGKGDAERVEAAFKDVEGIRRILQPRDFPGLGMTTPDQDPRMADLVLAAKEGYSFTDSAAGDAIVTETALKGSHGYLPDDPKLYAMFIAWGAGIRPGARLPVTDSINVAPTVARILGLELDHADGKPLLEVLK